MPVSEYSFVLCVCGRNLGANVARQHFRKCAVKLRQWVKDGRCILLLDERLLKKKLLDPIPCCVNCKDRLDDTAQR